MIRRKRKEKDDTSYDTLSYGNTSNIGEHDGFDI